MDAWTRIDQVAETLRRRWDRGVYLSAHAAGEPWSPVTVPLKAPGAHDLLSDPAAVVAWAGRIRRSSTTPSGRARFAVEERTVRNRALGANDVPARIRFDTFEQLTSFLGVAGEVDRFDRVLDATRRHLPALTAWVTSHPTIAVRDSDVWDRLLLTVRWIVEHDTGDVHLRHVDVAGVDTKFIERHRKVIAQMLDVLLPAARIDGAASGFAGRYRFRRRPVYVRFRLLAPVPGIPAPFSEVTVRADELASSPLAVATVFIVENQTTYLAFPEVPGAIVVDGAGFAVTTLEMVPWLADREVVYWGDIDTHGFAILHRLRERVASVRSMLMDRRTLLAHRDQFVEEDNPTSAPLPLLTDEEAGLYRDLVEDRYGSRIRLEQERVRFSLVRQAVAPR